ncbi:phosphoglycolate phosphatase [Shewanella hafniensis]|uniref:phosphoglycolate phosphatase n=1 Tax=Shewanella hafniensis TaxID=365590 RepID=UPI001BC2D739|nr:phosphoglycolate phosphatase [Shewanella hafniensis]MCL1136060.1 phosphoglycolate phosphatase [Shewanella hafniensis]GIU29962.1 phosphoglycolate phosphatase [Shewanella hafniensis]
MWDKIKAIAFDLDGTLIDSVPDLAVATQQALAELGLKSCSEAQVRTWVGNGAEMLMRRAMTHALGADVEQTALDAAMPIFMNHYQENLEKHSALYSDVHQVLQTLFDAGFKLAVVTNKPYRFTLPLLNAFGINDFFSLVLGGDTLAKMKPDPLPLQHLLHEWQLDKEALLMVGDSKNDILAAKAAGIASIGLTYGYNYGEDIGLSGPDAVCEQFSEILNWVNLSSNRCLPVL